VRRPPTVAGVLVGVLVLAGCGVQGPAPVTAPAGGSGEVSVTGRPAVAASPASEPSAAVDEAEPSLPPGDPGLDAPEAPDPGTAGPAPHGHDEEPLRAVPAASLLTAGTVGMALGGTWERRAGGGDECLRPQDAVANRSMTFGGAVEALVVETVATYPDAAAADRAVAGLGEAAAGCGWAAGPDPRIGSASVTATDGPRTMTAVSAEGVLVLVVGNGDLTRDPARWGSLVDLALGTSCAAAADGCH
jgi:hypothetical protein